MLKFSIRIVLVLFVCILPAFGQAKVEKIISDSLTIIANSYASVGRVNNIVISTDLKANTITVAVGEQLSQIPFRAESVKRIYNMLGNVLASKYPDFKIVCITDNEKIENLIPLYFTDNSADYKTRNYTSQRQNSRLITNLSKPYASVKGLDNKNIALWQSHGLYYNQSQNKWLWQRAKLFQTVEDLYTQSYVLPFLVPMLENAGATVFLPRERDIRSQEVIIDNDSKASTSRYRETADGKQWIQQKPGFGHFNPYYIQGENPFLAGSYVQADTEDDPEELSTVEWIPNIPETGKYAVYISYKSLKNSAPDARYSVYYSGGETHFKINQSMGGGTWIYLGHFMFEKGRNAACKVVLSNFSAYKKKIVTADAVKIGGGTGNIARYNKQQLADSLKSTDSLSFDVSKLYSLSNYPRYTEGARYWLQWAGMPDSIYSRTGGANDYSDDFQSRGFWVNYLAGGSSVLPHYKGLGIPIDMAFAFHSDAGYTHKDTIIGTLGICSVKNTYGKTVFANGNSRLASRDLTDLIQTQIVNDVRFTLAPEWTRRGLWNKSYSESRTPEVPTMLLELLSHQNFADMRYGLDPRFRFTVSRAIYKGMLRFLRGTSAVVQPLPVEKLQCRFVSKNRLRISWKPVLDPIEPTAKPLRYIVYTRINEEGFGNGRVVDAPNLELDLQIGKIYSFMVTAVNDGGESFPSEIVSACKMNNSRREVLIVNGFERVCGPLSFTKNGSQAGFDNDADPGVPYLMDYAFVGKQREYNRARIWKSDDDPGFGAGYSNYENKVIAGNTFDYAYLHGKAIRNAGYSFVSTSIKAVIGNELSLNSYQYVDLVLGKQKKSVIGKGTLSPEFETFPAVFQQQLKGYLDKGGCLFLSGAFIGSDLYDANFISTQNRFFMENVLHYKLKSVNETLSDKALIVPSPYAQFDRVEFKFYNNPNEKSYYVEKVDAIEPAGPGAFTICRLSGSNNSAAVAYSGKYKCFSMSIPFETIYSEKERNKIMSSVLHFFDVKKTTNQILK